MKTLPLFKTFLLPTMMLMVLFSTSCGDTHENYAQVKSFPQDQLNQVPQSPSIQEAIASIDAEFSQRHLTGYVVTNGSNRIIVDSEVNEMPILPQGTCLKTYKVSCPVDFGCTLVGIFDYQGHTLEYTYGNHDLDYKVSSPVEHVTIDALISIGMLLTFPISLPILYGIQLASQAADESSKDSLAKQVLCENAKNETDPELAKAIQEAAAKRKSLRPETAEALRQQRAEAFREEAARRDACFRNPTCSLEEDD